MTYYTFMFTVTTAWLLRVEGIALGNNISENLYNLISSSHNKDIRPCMGCGSPLVLNITFHFTSLNELDEVAGEMNSVGYMTVTWFDERIQWHPAQFGGLTSLHMPFDKVWTPVLVVGNPTRKISKFYEAVSLVRVMANGKMIWSPGDVFHTKFYPNIYRYPLDAQTCCISILPFGFLASEIMVKSTLQANGGGPGYQDSGEWVLENTESEDVIVGYFSVVRFYFTFRRRSEFFIVNIILPIIFLSCLNCLVFKLPTQSGERVSFSVTVLLSFTVFMTLVEDNIPKTSDPIPLLCYYLISVFTASSLIMVCSIYSINIYNRDAEIAISGIYRLIVTCSKFKAFARKTVPDMSMETPVIILADKENVVGQNKHAVQANRSNEIENTKDRSVTWHDVAACLDTICLIGFFLYFAICSLVFLFIIPVVCSE